MDEVDWKPAKRQPAPEDIVGVRIEVDELTMRAQVKAASARWEPIEKVWRLPYAKGAGSGLERPDRQFGQQAPVDQKRGNTLVDAEAGSTRRCRQSQLDASMHPWIQAAAA